VPESVRSDDTATFDDPDDPEVEAWLRPLPENEQAATRKVLARLEELEHQHGPDRRWSQHSPALLA